MTEEKKTASKEEEKKTASEEEKVVIPKEEMSFPTWIYHKRRGGKIDSRIVRSQEEFDKLEPGWINSLAKCKANSG